MGSTAHQLGKLNPRPPADPCSAERLTSGSWLETPPGPPPLNIRVATPGPYVRGSLTGMHVNASDQAPYALRAMLRRVSPDRRSRNCGVQTVAENPAIVVVHARSGPRASFTGLLACGRIWTCPVCSRAKRARRAARIDAAVSRGGRWQMVTFTPRHRMGMRLGTLMRGLSAAFRRVKQGGAMQRIWSSRVTASVRATEVTYGENGWHPHLHVLIRSSDWTDDERAELLRRWRTAIVAELGDACDPSDERAIRWSDAIDGARATVRAGYLSKLGLELSGFGKDGEGVPWRAGKGDPAAVRLWHEYVDATRGRRMIELDDRAAALARETMLDRCAAHDHDAGDDTGVSRVDVVPVWSEEVRALRRGERRRWDVHTAVLDAVARAADPGEEWRRWVRWCDGADSGTMVRHELHSRASPSPPG